jgi:ligand-binding SRPBCC domain-containing protein
MTPHILETVTQLNRPLNEVFDFFSRAENLNQLTPPELQFKILTPLPIHIQKNTQIDYKIKLSGIPFNWRTRITAYEPPYRFVDEQEMGPYKIWHHEHRFEDKGDFVLMTDRVQFLSPGWFLEPIINKLFVEPRVRAIFEYRTQQLKKLF